MTCGWSSVKSKLGERERESGGEGVGEGERDRKGGEGENVDRGSLGARDIIDSCSKQVGIKAER